MAESENQNGNNFCPAPEPPDERLNEIYPAMKVAQGKIGYLCPDYGDGFREEASVLNFKR